MISPSPAAHVTMRKPRLILPLGDPAGIGPEVVLKALSNKQFEQAADITVIGSKALLDQTYQSLNQQTQSRSACDRYRHPDSLTFVNIDFSKSVIKNIAPTQGNAASGEVSFRTLERAIALTCEGHYDGIVTAPIAKSAWLAAGHAYPGQTELLAQMSQTERYGMFFVAQSPNNGWRLRTLLATTHIPLQQVPTALTPDLMSQKLNLLIDCLQVDFGIEQPWIAIAGLNPHSGEQGQLGTEEKDWLTPWLIQQQQRHPNCRITGPIPPDTLWVNTGLAWNSPTPPAPGSIPDAYLALYHDQGLIPVKLLAFDLAVNTTIGLPFVRTSPDHGTAFDIARQGIARSDSTEAALRLAIDLTQQRLIAKAEQSNKLRSKTDSADPVATPV